MAIFFNEWRKDMPTATFEI